MMNFKVNNYYWVWVNNGIKETVNVECYDNLKYLKLFLMTRRLDNGIKYCFIDDTKKNQQQIIMNDWQVEDRVFKSRDLFLKHLVAFKDRLNTKNNFAIKFDEALKEKIKKSQENAPQDWI